MKWKNLKNLNYIKNLFFFSKNRELFVWDILTHLSYMFHSCRNQKIDLQFKLTILQEERLSYLLIMGLIIGN